MLMMDWDIITPPSSHWSKLNGSEIARAKTSVLLVLEQAMILSFCWATTGHYKHMDRGDYEVMFANVYLPTSGRLLYYIPQQAAAGCWPA